MADDDNVDVVVNDDGAQDDATKEEPEPIYTTEEPAGGGDGGAELPTRSQSEEYDMQATGCLCGLIVASCVTLAQSTRDCDKFEAIECDGVRGYVISVAAISLIFCLVMLIGRKYKPDIFEKWMAYFSLFLVVWWGFGTAFATFDNVFPDTGNGYFACWGAVFISIYFAQISVEKFKSILGKAFSSAVAGNATRRTLMLVMVFSYVEAFACLTSPFKNEDGGDFTTQELWGFLAGIIAGALITILMLLRAFANMLKSQTITTYFAYFLVVWWLFGAGVVTFDSPFTNTGNGYFMAWGAFLGSVYLAYLVHFGTEEGEAEA